MSKWLDQHSRNVAIVGDVAFNLSTLARSFRRVGNYALERELDSYSKLLRKASEEMCQAVVQSIKEDLIRAHKDTATILNALVGDDRDYKKMEENYKWKRKNRN